MQSLDSKTNILAKILGQIFQFWAPVIFKWPQKVKVVIIEVIFGAPYLHNGAR